MKKQVRKLILFARQWKNELCWFVDSRLERKKIKKSKKQKELKGKKMILIPHADDEWIGCSSILLDEEKPLLINMDKQGGDSVELHKKRRYELESIAIACSCQMLTVSEHLTLKEIINQFLPDYIFVPSFLDWHEEHFEVMEELQTTISEIDNMGNLKIAMYQVSIPIPEHIVTHVVPLSRKRWKRKWHRFRKHYKTQKHIPHKRFACHELINGKMIDSYAAEVFAIFDAFEWAKALDIMRANNNDKEYFKKHINQIASIRRYLKGTSFNPIRN